MGHTLAPLTEFRTVLALEDSRLFTRVLQCPVVEGREGTCIRIAFATRDNFGQSIIVVALLDAREGTSLARVENVLRPNWHSGTCVGLFPGAFGEIPGRGYCLVLQALSRDEGILRSAIFSAKIHKTPGGALDFESPQPLLSCEQDDSAFLALPRIHVMNGCTRLVVSYGFRDSRKLHRFPDAYGLHYVPLSASPVSAKDLRPVFWPEPHRHWAVAGFAHRLDEPSSYWTSIRRTIGETRHYQLTSVPYAWDESPEGAIAPSDFESLNGTRGAYPETHKIFGQSAVLVSMGNFGSGGLGMVRIR